jgi:predicted nucleic acid-binding protein
MIRKKKDIQRQKIQALLAEPVASGGGQISNLSPEATSEVIMLKSVYIESSVISYRIARLSRDVVVLARQEITAEWWDNVLPNLDGFVSPVVLEEISLGDRDSAERRLQIAECFQSLEVNDSVRLLAEQIVAALKLHDHVLPDAYHLALPAVHGIDYLVTWNCKHIANAFMIKRIEKIVVANGYEMPVVCTPEELMEEI